MLKERDLGKKVTQVGLRFGAALLAVQMSFGIDRVAHADINEPVRYPLADGRLLADAPLRSAGRAVDFTGFHGLEFCGTSTTEPTILTLVANEDAMNIEVAGNPDVFVDPIEVAGSDYPSRAASTVEALQSKASELINRTNRLWRRVAVILTRDAVNKNVCDLITDSGAFAPETPVVPVRPAAVAAGVCPSEVTEIGSPYNIIDNVGRVTGQIYGVPSRVGPAGLDLADHDIFRNTITALRNVLGEPGAFLADRNRIAATEPQNLGAWDGRVAAGLAEYLVSGVNFFGLQNASSAGLTRDASGRLVFSLTIPQHEILRADFEEICATLISPSRRIGLALFQVSTVTGSRAHYTVFLRTPYFETAQFTAYSPTVPGTEVQLFGRQVASPTAFASELAFGQGVGPRQARPDVPGYYVVTVNSNDLTLGEAVSTGPGVPITSVASNY